MPYETTDEADGAREGGGFPLASHPHSASVCSAGARSALLSAWGGCPAPALAAAAAAFARRSLASAAAAGLPALSSSPARRPPESSLSLPPPPSRAAAAARCAAALTAATASAAWSILSKVSRATQPQGVSEALTMRSS